MEQLQKENLTLGLTGPEVTYREATAQGAAGVNLIVVLGALTFGLQLCLVLFLISRCQRLDNRIRDALKRPETAGKGDALSSLHRNMYKQANNRCDKDSSSSPAVCDTSDQHMNPNHLFAPSIPWDLVQS